MGKQLVPSEQADRDGQRQQVIDRAKRNQCAHQLRFVERYHFQHDGLNHAESTRHMAGDSQAHRHQRHIGKLPERHLHARRHQHVHRCRQKQQITRRHEHLH